MTSSMVSLLCGGRNDALSSGDEVEDKGATDLSYVGRAAYD
jgi:hypothetical protein